MVRRATREVGVGLGVTLLFMVLCIQAAYAGDKPPHNRPPDNRPPTGEVDVNLNGNNNELTSTTDVSVHAEGGDGGTGGAATSTIGDVSSAGGEASSHSSVGDTTAMGGEGGASSSTASNDGVTVESTDNSENNNTNVVLVPNNNTAGCMRVFGISFGTHDGAAALGAPFRDEACDFEQAADDAAARGDHKIAWWWRCHKKNLYKTFKQKGDTKEMAHLKCWNSMTEMLTGQVIVDKDEYDSLMAQAVQKEELEEYAEQIEYRYSQQQNLIDSLKQEHEQDEQELARLKRKAAELAAEQQAQKDNDAARRAAALKALSKKGEREAKDDG